MANKNITDLTAATTPLAGTELIPVWDSVGTKKVSIDNLTAGRPAAGATVFADASDISILVLNCSYG